MFPVTSINMTDTDIHKVLQTDRRFGEDRIKFPCAVHRCRVESVKTPEGDPELVYHFTSKVVASASEKDEAIKDRWFETPKKAQDAAMAKARVNAA